MKTEARVHHYEPQCYLRGFGESGRKKVALQVYDLAEGRWFPSNPRNIGAQRDFNRMEVDGQPPDALESGLSAFEGEVAKVLEWMRRTHRLPDGKEFVLLMNLIGLMAARNPSLRNSILRFEVEIANTTMALILSTKERFEITVQQMKEGGVEVNESITYEDVKKWYEKGEYEVDVPRERVIPLEFHGFDAILDTLMARKWTLCVACGDSGHFITSDHPVTLTWTDPAMKAFPPPGYGDEVHRTSAPGVQRVGARRYFRRRRSESPRCFTRACGVCQYSYLGLREATNLCIESDVRVCRSGPRRVPLGAHPQILAVVSVWLLIRQELYDPPRKQARNRGRVLPFGHRGLPPQEPDQDQGQSASLLSGASTAGMVNQNVHPCPGSLSTPISPPCASTISFEMERPMPAPPDAAPGTRKNFSKTLC